MARQSRDQRPRSRLLGAAISVAGHLAVLTALLWMWAEPPATPEPPAVVVALIDEPSPTPKAAPPGAKSPSPARSPPRHARAPPAHPKPAHAQQAHAKSTHAPSHDVVRPTEESADAEPGTELSDAQIAGASTAGSGSGSGGGGGGGGVCDMATRVQVALRKDPLVRAALAGAAGKAAMVWNGDWVRGQGEDGKGLAAVREAIMWEIAFAPPACRAQSMRGLVVLSLNETAGSARLAVGTGEWRWSDLLALNR